MSTKKDSLKQERRGAKLHGGKVTPGSGNTPWRKNDMRTETESWECKVTSAKQFTLKHADLVKAEEYALLDGRDMRFELEMCDRHWVLMSEEDFISQKEEILVLKTLINLLEQR